MFTIKNSKLSPNGQIDTLVITGQDCRIEIMQGFGCALNRFDYKGMSFVQGYEDEAELLHSYEDKSAGALLFPFANRLNAGKYRFNGQDYQLPINFKWQHHAIHGLLVTEGFQLVKQYCDDNTASVTLALGYSANAPGYPFYFSVEVTWSLDANNTLSCSTNIINNGDQALPYSLGWHPYFTLNGQCIDDYQLAFPSKKRVICDELDLPTGEFVSDGEFNQPTTIKQRFLNHCWQLDPQKEITLSSPNCPYTLRIKQADYEYFQVYTPATRTAIALEPMTSIANVFNHPQHLLLLEPKASRSFQWSVTLR